MVDMIGLKKCVDDMGLTAEELTEILLHKLQFLEKYPMYAMLMNQEIDREDCEAHPGMMNQKIIKDTLVDIFIAASTLAMVTKSKKFKWKGFVEDGWRYTEEDIYPAVTWFISKNIGHDAAVEMMARARDEVEEALGEK
jgi:hypothetical protein